MTTEAEAKQKWCPMIRYNSIGDETGTNMPKGQHKCIGSECMAWRWGVWDEFDKLDKSRGYCGLAGNHD